MTWVPHLLHPLLFAEGIRVGSCTASHQSTQSHRQSLSAESGVCTTVYPMARMLHCVCNVIPNQLASRLMSQQPGAHYTKLLKISSLLNYNFTTV